MSSHLKGKGIVSYIKTANNAFFNLIYAICIFSINFC